MLKPKNDFKRMNQFQRIHQIERRPLNTLYTKVIIYWPWHVHKTMKINYHIRLKLTKLYILTCYMYLKLLKISKLNLILHIWPWPHSLCFDLYYYGTYPRSLSPAHHEGRFCPETQVVCTRYTSTCPQGEGFWNLPQNSVVSNYKDISSIWLKN